MAEAIEGVIVHEAGRLHERVADGRADELEAASDQATAKHGGGLGFCRALPARAPAVLLRPAAHEAPEVGIEASVLALDGEERARVGDGRLDLASMTNDPLVGQQSLDASAGESCH